MPSGLRQLKERSRVGEPQGVAELWRTGHNMPLLQSQLYLAWAECCLEGNLSQCLDHSNISRGNRDHKFKNRDL